MTTISALTASTALAPAPVVARTDRLPVQHNAGVRVELTGGKASSSVYIEPSPAPSAGKAVCERSADDTVSALMQRNFSSTAPELRFKGLGGALLERFRTDGSSYSQSLMQARPGSLDAASQLAELHRETENQVTLSVKTASGKAVQIKLGSGPDGLAVSVETANDEALSAEERNALADLSTAFQDAIDGLAGGDAALKVSGLMAFDTKVLSSVDLKANIKQHDRVQSLSLHADAKSRSLEAVSAAGTVKVDVDLSQSGLLGKASQRDAAVRDYLNQFDRARQRGDGEQALMTQFKDAFKALHSHYGNASEPDRLSREVTLSRGDRSVLSGMADFSASISQVSTSPNTALPQERDSFNYEASQRTAVTGENTANRSVRQEQQSALKASYHRPLQKDIPMNLGGARETQNYNYYEIADRSKSLTEIAYKDGELIKADLSSVVNESTKVSKFINGKQAEVNDIPSEFTQRKSLRSLLRASDRAAMAGAREQLRQHQPLLIENGYDKLASTAAKVRVR
ncbi:hypothetical protein C0J09_03470 [Bordetella avium]|uniref:hypothetical protein n=1 Tax=Bordetella avium TaxID=521 RepID=UPI000FD98A23|nr:hypothetical protein [Bordetella avium]AZY48297.1 hypothetical protein C0J09_03470 [Bordetella avium]